MRVTTLIIIIVIIGGVAFWAHKAGYFGKAQTAVQDSFTSHYEVGQQKYRTMDYTGAIQELEAAIKAGPDHPEVPSALYRIGDCYREMKQNAKAIEVYQKVIQDYPDFKMRGQVEQSIEKTRTLGGF